MNLDLHNLYVVKYHETRGLWLQKVEDENGRGVSFEEGRNIILDTYKHCIDIWKSVTEQEFIDSDIVRKIQKQGEVVG